MEETFDQIRRSINTSRQREATIAVNAYVLQRHETTIVVNAYVLQLNETTIVVNAYALQLDEDINEEDRKGR